MRVCQPQCPLLVLSLSAETTDLAACLQAFLSGCPCSFHGHGLYRVRDLYHSCLLHALTVQDF
ncbi:hypothetical protein GBAR_LOCUS767 [Geodia barretti]|uniref:Uncharacterized protein n=1 Tax=Geodia barretti TaxID=519541 RepID=A0AA35VTG3_GEOBA|nr:hypothetical protein GBAR_LOCUS767 [Geodia barretti]